MTITILRDISSQDTEVAAPTSRIISSMTGGMFATIETRNINMLHESLTIIRVEDSTTVAYHTIIKGVLSNTYNKRIIENIHNLSSMERWKATLR